MSDLGDILELMHTAHQRPKSLRAVVHHWADNAVIREAMERRQKDQPRGSAVMFMTGAGRPPPYRDETYQVWAQEPGRRWRVEWTSHGKAYVTILNGQRWWGSGFLDGFITNVCPDGTIAQNVGGDLPSALATVFDPAPMAAAVAIFRVITSSHKGRDVISAVGRPRSERDRGVHLWALGAPYADEVQFSIDVATGFVLRWEMLLDRRVFMLWQIEEMELEHDPPASLFEGPADARLPPMPPTPDEAELRRVFERDRRRRPPSI